MAHFGNIPVIDQECRAPGKVDARAERLDRLQGPVGLLDRVLHRYLVGLPTGR